MYLNLAPALNDYVQAYLPPIDPLFNEIEQFTLTQTTSPQMLSGRLQAHLLATLARMSGAKRILEIGCFTGYTSLYLAAYSGCERVTTLDVSPEYAKIAQGFFARHQDGVKVQLILGDALESLKQLAGETFDFVYIDADKERYVAYFNAVRELLAPQGTIVADNVLRDGKVIDLADESAGTRGIRLYNEHVTHLEGFTSFILPLRDGLMISRRS